MNKIKIGIVGIGNCASALLQGIRYYDDEKKDRTIGLMHYNLGGYKPEDIEVVLAYDIDKRKVGKDIALAMYEKPNCTTVFYKYERELKVEVKMGKVLDSVAEHMKKYQEDIRFCVSDHKEPSKDEIIRDIRKSGAEMLINYLPVGSEQATRFYAECALEAGVGFINCIPVFIGSDEEWVRKFEKKNVPLIGDDIKSQLGATIIHRVLADTCSKRGVKIERSYQLNTGGNTDFLNMIDRDRLKSKKISKTDAVNSLVEIDKSSENLHVGPSDFVPWQKDNKICFIRIEGKMFGDIPFDLDLRLSVEDSPNSAGVVIDAIRCCKLALNQKIGGLLLEPSMYFCKHPLKQTSDSICYENLERYIGELTQR